MSLPNTITVWFNNGGSLTLYKNVNSETGANMSVKKRGANSSVQVQGKSTEIEYTSRGNDGLNIIGPSQDTLTFFMRKLGTDMTRRIRFANRVAAVVGNNTTQTVDEHYAELTLHTPTKMRVSSLQDTGYALTALLRALSEIKVIDGTPQIFARDELYASLLNVDA